MRNEVRRVKELRIKGKLLAGSQQAEVAGVPATSVLVLDTGPKKESKFNLASTGSVSMFPVNEHQMELVPRMMKQFRNLSYYLFSIREEITYRKGRTIKAADFEQFLTVANLMAIIPNKWHDEQAPQARAKCLWNRLYEDGHFTRGWDTQKWCVLWRIVVDGGFLNVLDNRYWFTPDQHAGKAMEWVLYSEYQVRFADLERREENRNSIYERHVPVYVPSRIRPQWVSSPKRVIITGHDPGVGVEMDQKEMYRRFKAETLCA